jgi:predicted metal-dependent phosphoesterase TrpH
MAKADFHNHSTASDGKLTPGQLVDLAASRGVKVFAVTDHDSTQGIREARAHAEKHDDFILVPGCELSTDIDGAEVHVLGYFDFDKIENPELQAELARFREGRVARGQEMVKKLIELGKPISWERVLEIAGEASVGRPHVAQALVEAGHVQTITEAFDKYIGRDGPAYAEREKMSPETAIRTLKKYGAAPILAHPSYIKGSDKPIEDIEPLLRDFQAAGLAGMEVYYKDYDEEMQSRLAALARKLGLIPLGGSDYHALKGPGEREPGDIPLPSRVAKDFLEQQLPWVRTTSLT